MLSFTFEAHAADQRPLRTALSRFATGVTVITTQTPGGKLEGLTANSFAALSLDPPLVLWSIRLSAPSLPSFLSANSFAINVLAAEQRSLSIHFATPCVDKFEDVSFSAGLGGCPVLPDSLALFECNIEDTVEAGDHLIFIGRVVRATYRQGKPLLFSGGEYCIPVKHPPATAEVYRLQA